MASITQMEYALAVLQHRHFGRAAEAVNISQPTLSMQLQKLEEELEAVLFDRSKKPIQPTTQGARLLEQMKIVVEEERRLVDMSRSDKGLIGGDFKLGVIPTLSPYVIPLFMDAFSKSHPQVNLTIEELKTSEIITALDEGRVDAGLLVTPLYENRFEEKVLFYEPFYLYVSPKHPYYKRARIREEDLEQGDIWLLGEGHCLRNQVVSICSARNASPVYKNVSFESGSLETLKRLVDHSQGYTLMPHLAVMNYKDADTKKKIKPFIRPVPTREVSLVYRKRNLKEGIISGISHSITSNLPKILTDLRENEIEIVDI